MAVKQSWVRGVTSPEVLLPVDKRNKLFPRLDSDCKRNLNQALRFHFRTNYFLIHYYYYYYYYYSIGTTTLVGFRPAKLSLSILSRKVLQSAVASGTSTPKLGGYFSKTLHKQIFLLLQKNRQ
jgi:hypothetical protein